MRDAIGFGAAYPVGIIGSGFIIDSVALRSYARAGINVVAIASRHAGRASVADHWGIPRSYREPATLLDDLEVSSSRWPIPRICRPT